jgi:hypothetical protein
VPDFPEILESPSPALMTTPQAAPVCTYFSNTANQPWTVANKAIFVPFIIDDPVTAYAITFETLTGTDNLDMGIYDLRGTRLVSTGSIVNPAGHSTVDIADTILQQGYYFMAMAASSTSNNIKVTGINVLSQFLRQMGVCEMLSAFPLPATATLSPPSANFTLPYFGIHFKSVI